MAITTGASIIEEDSATTVISDTSAIADGGFNGGTITALTPSDVTGVARAVLDVAMAVAPAAGKQFHLYRRDLNVDGTDDAPVPDANNQSIYVGSFTLDAVTARQYPVIPVVPLSKDQEFYIENDTGESTTGTTVVKIIPWARNTK